jgi:hypothetical protein
MSTQEEAANDWDKKKEELKLKFALLTDKYSFFEGNKKNELSEKLQLRFAKTKKELHEIIAAL